MRVQVMIPDGKGPFPVLISPNLAGWGPSLLRRGYISCGYAAMMPWTTRPRWTNFIPITISLYCRAAHGPPGRWWTIWKLCRRWT